jgi:DNA-binding NarL/FixJ family response regulator
MTLTLMLADDHRIVRQGLRAILTHDPGLQLVGEASDGIEAARMAERLQPDVLVLDLMMPGLGGLEVARRVVRRSPRTQIVILSMHSNEAYVVEALRAGARAFVLKESSAEDLVKAIYEVAAGRRYFSPPITEPALSAYLDKTEGTAVNPLHTLTEREREVLQLTTEGHSGIEVGKRLHISPRTVETHRANIMRKLGVRNQKELVRFAMQRGLLPPVDERGGRGGMP